MTNKLTELQQWAWDRYHFKGSIAMTIGLIHHLKDLQYITPGEYKTLRDAESKLADIQHNWAKRHNRTRKEASDKK